MRGHYSFRSFFGLPRPRRVNSDPSRLAVAETHSLSPQGPITNDARADFSGSTGIEHEIQRVQNERNTTWSLLAVEPTRPTPPLSNDPFCALSHL